MLARVPWTPKLRHQAPRKRLTKEKRRQLVDAMTAILREGESSKFEFEASCRHGLRTSLCLKGWSWGEADETAAAIVHRALNIIGAVRPTWYEGQPEWTQNDSGALIARTRCIRCRHRLEETQAKFCSKLCAGAHHMALSSIREARGVQAYDLAVNGARRSWWKFECA